MSSAEQAVRLRALMLLAADGELAERVHGVFDGTPPRASAPYVSVGAAEGRDWGTKDRARREVRVTIMLTGVGESGDGIAMRRIETVAAAMRGSTGAWDIVAAHVVRTRFAFARDGGWRHEVVARCRCLKV